MGSRLMALNVARSGSTSRSSHSRVTANGGATAHASAVRARALDDRLAGAVEG